jgi:hypothetical protein
VGIHRWGGETAAVERIAGRVGMAAGRLADLLGFTNRKVTVGREPSAVAEFLTTLPRQAALEG